MGKGKKWMGVENEALVRAYIAVSEDLVKGNEQKSTTFWGEIKKQFDALLR
jgi:hypothetical protein